MALKIIVLIFNLSAKIKKGESVSHTGNHTPNIAMGYQFA
jgi:hypothetical protein